MMRRLLVLTFMFVAAACQSLRPGLPILDNPACEPPCWQNIVPGKTNERGLRDRLSSLPFVEKDSISSVYVPDSAFMGTIHATLYHGKPYQTKFYSYFLDGKVAVISLGGSWHITLSETIEKLGTPQNVVIVRYNGDVYGNFIDPARGISFGYTTIWKAERWRTEINPDIEIEWINFFDPASYNRVLDSGIFSSWLLNPEQMAQVTYPWDGYGNLDEKYPSWQP